MILRSRAALVETIQKDRSPRRTLIIVEDLPASTDQRLWSEAKTLHQAGYEVSIICPKGRHVEAREETIEGIHIFRHPTLFKTRKYLGKIIESSFILFWDFMLSIKIARRHGFDVIHICNPPDIIYLIGAIYKIFRKKSVLFDYRDASPERYEATFGKRNFFWQLRKLIERRAFKSADVSLSINESHRKIAISRGRMSPDRNIVIRACPDIEHVKPGLLDARWRNGRTYLVCYAGDTSKDEGLDLLVDAINYIVHEHNRSDIQFVIVGGGPEWHEIANLCAKMDLSEFVTFAGLVDDKTLFTILSTADICVDPRRVTPVNIISTSHKLMKYMAMGKPIVQFDMNEGRLLVQDASRYAKANDPIDFAKMILELIEHPKIRNLMGEFGRQRVKEELSWRREQRKLLVAYDALFALHEQRSARPQIRKEQKTRKPYVSKQR
jgi:glycosyltransferase involved in cell wall biosynthesis